MLLGEITTKFFNSSDQLADVFTKSLKGHHIDYICNELGAYDIYAPAWGGMLDLYVILYLLVDRNQWLYFLITSNWLIM